jgi:hypothetical protein
VALEHLLLPGTHQSTFHKMLSTSQKPDEVGAVTNPTLYMKDLRQAREVE